VRRTQTLEQVEKVGVPRGNVRGHASPARVLRGRTCAR
jgi:hypothetical protein